MKLSLFEDEFEVPMEMDGVESVQKNKIESPKCKSSKLCMDKGFVKATDELFKDLKPFSKNVTHRERGGSDNIVRATPLQANCKSSRDVADVLNSSGDMAKIMMRMRLTNKNVPSVNRSTYQRKRIQSFNTDFSILPLLRKVTPCTKKEDKSSPKSIMKSSIKKPKKVSFCLENMEDEVDENSVSDAQHSDPFFITMEDCSPGRSVEDHS